MSLSGGPEMPSPVASETEPEAGAVEHEADEAEEAAPHQGGDEFAEDEEVESLGAALEEDAVAAFEDEDSGREDGREAEEAGIEAGSEATVPLLSDTLSPAQLQQLKEAIADAPLAYDAQARHHDDAVYATLCGHTHSLPCPHIASSGHRWSRTIGLNTAPPDHIWPRAPLASAPPPSAARGRTWLQTVALRFAQEETDSYLDFITDFSSPDHLTNQLERRAQMAAAEMAANAQGAADLTIPALKGTTLPQFLEEPGQNVYGSLPAGPKPLFDIDALHLHCPWEALRYHPELLGMHVNLSSRGSFVDGNVLRGYVNLVDGATKVYMPIGGTGGHPCYRNRCIALSLAMPGHDRC